MRGDAVLIKHKVHAGEFDLIVQGIGPLQPAINTAALPTPVAVVLVASTGLPHIWPVARLLGQAEATPEGSGAAGCGSMCLLADGLDNCFFVWYLVV